MAQYIPFFFPLQDQNSILVHCRRNNCKAGLHIKGGRKKAVCGLGEAGNGACGIWVLLGSQSRIGQEHKFLQWVELNQQKKCELRGGKPAFSSVSEMPMLRHRRRLQWGLRLSQETVCDTAPVCFRSQR